MKKKTNFLNVRNFLWDDSRAKKQRYRIKMLIMKRKTATRGTIETELNRTEQNSRIAIKPKLQM